MFEQALLDTRGRLKNPWAFTVSVAGQTLVISGVVLVSLIHTDALPRSGLFTNIVAPGVPKGPAATQKSRPQTARPANSAPPPFTAPSSVPTGITMATRHTPVLLSADHEFGDGIPVIGGPGDGSGLPAPPTDALRAAPPPPRHDPPAKTKPAFTAPAKPVHVSTGVQSARLLRQVTPVYPRPARDARISGTVRLVAIIGRDGAIQNLQVLSGHPFLTSAAVEAVKQWLYRPTLLNGEPVEVITQIDVNFTLSQ